MHYAAGLLIVFVFSPLSFQFPCASAMRLSKNNADALFALLLLLLLLADFDRTTRNALQIANAHTQTDTHMHTHTHMARIRNQCAAICVWRLKKTHAICAIYSLQLHCGQPQQQRRICCQRSDDDCDCSSEGPTTNSFHTAQHQQSATTTTTEATTERPTAAAQWCISYAIYVVNILLPALNAYLSHCRYHPTVLCLHMFRMRRELP